VLIFRKAQFTPPPLLGIVILSSLTSSRAPDSNRDGTP
jgi:hypothetical protein